MHAALIIFINSSLLAGCNDRIGGYIAASSITKNGFALNADEMQKAHGREIRIWGFVDHSNLYGDDSGQKILEDWWSGYGPSAAFWRFNLKAEADEDAGQSLQAIA